MGLAPTSFPILEQEIVRFTVTQPCVFSSVPVQTNAPTLDSGPRDCLAHDLMDRGEVACTARTHTMQHSTYDAVAAMTRVRVSHLDSWKLYWIGKVFMENILKIEFIMEFE